MPQSLSVAIVCKDNARTIGRTLGSVKGWAGEVVAVDSGSTDGTIAMLEAAGARVIRSAWLGFGPTKQLAMDACVGEWVLVLDSDESVLPDLRAAIGRVMAEEMRAGGRRGDRPTSAGRAGGGDGERPVAYTVNRMVWYAGRPLRHVWHPDRVVRLVRRGTCRFTTSAVHERLEPIDPAARVDDLPGILRHDTMESLAEHMVKQIGYARLAARERAAAGERGSVWRLITSPRLAMGKRLLLGAWLDGWRGVVVATAIAMTAAMKHALVLEEARGGSEAK